jgi:hypothetical protein
MNKKLTDPRSRGQKHVTLEKGFGITEPNKKKSSLIFTDSWVRQHVPVIPRDLVLVSLAQDPVSSPPSPPQKRTPKKQTKMMKIF